MEMIKSGKAKELEFPKTIKRYTVAFYNAWGWTLSGYFYTTPESAIEAFLESWNKIDAGESKPRFYKVFEFDLELPVFGEI